MRMLVLGAGLQGSACAYDLLQQPAVAQVTIADLKPERVPAFLKPYMGKRLTLLKLDVQDGGALRAAMAGHDAVLNAAPYYFNLDVVGCRVQHRIEVEVVGCRVQHRIVTGHRGTLLLQPRCVPCGRGIRHSLRGPRGEHRDRLQAEEDLGVPPEVRAVNAGFHGRTGHIEVEVVGCRDGRSRCGAERGTLLLQPRCGAERGTLLHRG